MSKSEPITSAEFEQMTRCLVGLPISRPWQGYATAFFAEVGPLTQTYKGSGRPKADLGLDFGYGWRVEGQRSILFGSFSGRRKIHNGIKSLTSFKIVDITLSGRLPELCVQLSDGRWIHSFASSEGQPEWMVFLNDSSWLTVKRGSIRKMSQTERL